MFKNIFEDCIKKSICSQWHQTTFLYVLSKKKHNFFYGIQWENLIEIKNLRSYAICFNFDLI